MNDVHWNSVGVYMFGGFSLDACSILDFRLILKDCRCIVVGLSLELRWLLDVGGFSLDVRWILDVHRIPVMFSLDVHWKLNGFRCILVGLSLGFP